MTKQPTKIPIKAIKALVEYLYEDEEQNYLGYCNDDGPLVDKDGRTHIFRSVRRVAAWLDREAEGTS